MICVVWPHRDGMFDIHVSFVELAAVRMDRKLKSTAMPRLFSEEICLIEDEIDRL